MPEQIDPDAEPAEGAEASKSFGQHMKDAAHDLKEDVKDVGRRNKDDEDDDEGSSDDSGDSGDDAA